VAVGLDGKVYIADTWNHRVQVFDREGQPVRTWGYYGTPDSSPGDPYTLWGPRAIAIDLDGNVLVADTGGKRIRVYTSEGVWLRDLGFGGSGLGQLDEPTGLAVNPISGNIYVADTWNRRVQEFTPDGQAIRFFEVPMWYDNRTASDRPYLAVSPDGRLLAVADMTAVGRNDGPRVVIFDLAGTPLLALNAPEVDILSDLYGIRNVAGLAFAPDSTLYVLDADTGRVLRFPILPVQGGIMPVPRPGSVPNVPPVVTPEVTPEATAEVTSETTPEATAEVSAETTPEVTAEPGGN
jgi:DNA-binding beta-propeller fold protein YncE